MSITINAKGTSVPSFTIGKNGTTLYQGTADPSVSYTMHAGDYWFDNADNSLWVWNGTASAWNAPKLADLTFTGSTIATTNADLTLSTSGANAHVTFAGDTGPGIITTITGQDLYIDPTLGGGDNLVLMDNRWPAADGVANQVITTDGTGILSFTTINRIGSPAPETTATSGHAYIPVTTGTPTGIPATISGYAPMIADSSGSKLWVYIGGVWKSTTLS